MKIRQRDAKKHKATVEEMEAQLTIWSAQLNDLAAGYLAAGAHSHDAYRLRVDGLRDRHGAAQLKVHDYTSMSDPTGEWEAFQTGIKDDWKALEDGLKDLAK